MVERKSGHKILRLRSDCGGEFLSTKSTVHLQQHGILRELTAAHSLQQNGTAERKNQMILNKVRVMLFGCPVPTFVWAEAARTAIQLMNLTPTRSNHHATSEELFTGIKPALSWAFTSEQIPNPKHTASGFPPCSTL